MGFGAEVFIALVCSLCLATCVELDSESAPAVKVTKENPSPSGSQRAPVVLARPAQPTTPECFRHFPGTPAWNECFQKYMREMAEFQAKMHEFVKSTTKDSGTSSNFPGGSYSQGSFNSQSTSTSNSYVGGYAIQATNMGLSTSVSNGILKVTFNTGGPIESFERKVEGNEIQFRVVSRGQQKSGRIIVPKVVRVEDVKLDRTADAIYLTAPAPVGGGFSQMSQSSSSTSGSGFSNQNFQTFGSGAAGQLPVGPAIPMPDLQNMFQNFLPSLFGGMPGGGAMSAQKARGSKGFPPGSHYPIPGIWFL